MTSQTTSINVSTQRATFAALLAALVAGIDTELPGIDPMVVDGVSVARADLLGRIQATLDAIAAVKVARTELQSAIAKQKVAIADARKLRGGVKRLAQSKLGPSSPLLQKLGFTPQRTAKPSVATKARAVAKADATRHAGGTKGKAASADATAAAPAGAVATTAPATSKS